MIKLESKYFLWFLAVAAILTVTRVVFIYVNDLPLWVDEAQYWEWSKNLDIGYFSKPPLIAFIISFFTNHCGDSEFCIRLPGAIMHFIASFFVYLAASNLFDRKTALWSSILYITYPAVSFSSVFFSTDAPLMMFWAMAFYFFTNTLAVSTKEGFISWLFLGIVIGLGLMSKYTMSVFIFSIFVYYFLKDQRRIFSINFYGSMILAYIIFLPNIIWNIDNSLVSYAHTAENVLSTEELSIDSINLNFADFFEFIGGQLIVVGPVVFIFAFIALFKKAEHQSKIHELDEKKSKFLLFIFFLPLILVGTAISLFMGGTQAHWAAPAYISGSILVSRFCLTDENEFWLKFSLAFNIIVIILMMNIKTITNSFDFNSPLERLTKWPEATNPVKKSSEKYKDFEIVTDERKFFVSLSYYLKAPNGEPAKVFKWNVDGSIKDQYDITSVKPIDDYDKVLFLTRSKDREYLKRYFRKVKEIKSKNLAKGFKLFIADK